MTCPQPLLRLAPITTGLVLRNPRVLLGGSHQPTLLRYLEGWPKRWDRQRNFLIRFAREGESLSCFASDSFDMAVIQAPSSEELPEVLGQLVRVARQGLITFR